MADLVQFWVEGFLAGAVFFSLLATVVKVMVYVIRHSHRVDDHLIAEQRE